MVAKILNFIRTDLWRLRLKDYSRGKSFLYRQLRIIILAVRHFNEDKCKFRASALTFYSVLSIVPIVAMMFGVAKGFGLEKWVESQVFERMQGQEEVAKKIVEFSNSLLSQTSASFIAGVGVAFLLWTIIGVLSNVETSFNDIWGVKKGRSLGRKFSDYLSTMLVCPILLAASSAATVFVGAQLQVIVEKVAILQYIGPVIMIALKILPYCTVWVAFTFILSFMPNAKVNFKSALIAGIVAGTMFQAAQWGYVNFQVQIATRYAVYGSFAALPLFLLWMQVSWLIVLFGAEVSFAHQNVETYEFEPDCLSASQSFKKMLSLALTERIVKRFANAEKASDASQLSRELEIPIRLVRQILYDLAESGVVSEVRKGEDKDVAYQPALDTGRITIKYVLDALEQRGTASVPVAGSKQLDRISDSLQQFSTLLEKSPANLALKDV